MHRRSTPILAAAALTCVSLNAQDRLKGMPGHDRALRMTAEAPAAITGAVLSVNWATDGTAFDYQKDARRYRYDIGTRHETEAVSASHTDARPSRGARGRTSAGPVPERGRQFEATLSPDGALKAFCRDRNLWLSAADGSNERAITTDGSASSRVKYGTASWVYGEELSQKTAMWWSPDGRKLAYYRFDETLVPDYYLTLNQTRLQSTLDVEAYPKSGAANPTVDLFIYDIATKQSIKVDARDGKPFDNAIG